MRQRPEQGEQTPAANAQRALVAALRARERVLQAAAAAAAGGPPEHRRLRLEYWVTVKDDEADAAFLLALYQRRLEQLAAMGRYRGGTTLIRVNEAAP
jgi:hypothetical protein